MNAIEKEDLISVRDIKIAISNLQLIANRAYWEAMHRKQCGKSMDPDCQVCPDYVVCDANKVIDKIIK